MRQVYFISAFILLALFLEPPILVQANGCSASLDEPAPTVAELIEASSVIFEGTVLAIGKNYNFDYGVATVRVHSYLKGNGPIIVHVSGYHESWTLYECADWVNAGENFIFYTIGESNQGLSKFSRTYTDEQTLNEISSISGQLSTPPQWALDTISLQSLTVILLGAGTIATGMVVFFQWKRKRKIQVSS